MKGEKEEKAHEREGSGREYRTQKSVREEGIDERREEKQEGTMLRETRG